MSRRRLFVIDEFCSVGHEAWRDARRSIAPSAWTPELRKVDLQWWTAETARHAEGALGAEPLPSLAVMAAIWGLKSRGALSELLGQWRANLPAGHPLKRTPGEHQENSERTAREHRPQVRRTLSRDDRTPGEHPENSERTPGEQGSEDLSLHTPRARADSPRAFNQYQDQHQGLDTPQPPAAPVVLERCKGGAERQAAPQAGPGAASAPDRRPSLVSTAPPAAPPARLVPPRPSPPPARSDAAPDTQSDRLRLPNGADVPADLPGLLGLTMHGRRRLSDVVFSAGIMTTQELLRRTREELIRTSGFGGAATMDRIDEILCRDWPDVTPGMLAPARPQERAPPPRSRPSSRQQATLDQLAQSRADLDARRAALAAMEGDPDEDPDDT